MSAVAYDLQEPPEENEFHILTDTLREIRDSIRDLRSDFRLMGGLGMLVIVLAFVGVLGLKFTLDTPLVGVSATPVVQVGNQ